MRLFWNKGFEATSIASLTKAMGVGSTSLYATFNSKGELYQAALNRYVELYGRLVWSRFHKAGSARDAAHAFLHDTAVAVTGGERGLPRGCMATLATVSDEDHASLGDLIRAGRTGAFDLLKARFQRGVNDGDLPSRADPDLLARFVQTVHSGMSIRARDGADCAELCAVADMAMAGWDRMVE